ncbi:MAG: hypothetical protein GXO64_00455 [Candidatus Micrarchaeota archaeon]|nr:hypothetical protein [Candidatus Micrarchaeota archaeon]
MVAPANLCVICKGGRNLCGHTPCPLLKKFRLEKKASKEIGSSFFGKGLSVFIGRYGYPNVPAGPMGSLDESATDDTRSLFGKSYDEIIELRSLLLRSRKAENIFSRSRFVEQNQEIALAKKSIDIELEFGGKPRYEMSFSDIVQPMGPTVSLKKFSLAENAPVPRRVDSIVNDEVPAQDASFMLYRFGYDVGKVSTILSSGALGSSEKRKLVPTRWSITAIDDTIAKKLMERIRDYPQISDFMVFSSVYMDNRFEVLLIPGSWEYENFEVWAPGTPWSFDLKKPQMLVEYEPYEGRTKYADKEGGGYYAARIAVCEKLNGMKKQAKAVVFREIYEGYVIPLGVWQVRENARNAMKSKPKTFSTLGDALDDIKARLRTDIKKYIASSRILRQRRIIDFLGFR